MTYDKFIDNILNTRGRYGIPENEYKERHHIIPKCMGGDNSESNMIDLYAKEHFIAHKLLAIENPDNYGCVYAWGLMAHCNSKGQERNYDITPEEYEELKKLMAINNSNFQKELWQDEEYRLKMRKARSGRKLSDEHRKKLSEALKGRKISDETREKIGNIHRGKKLTDEQKAKISNVTKGENNPMYGRTHTEDVKKKLSIIAHENSKDNKWWNNGVNQVFCPNCPDGYVNGRLPFKLDNKVGKYEHKKGMKKKLYKYVDENGKIVVMDSGNKNRWHPDWELYKGGEDDDKDTISNIPEMESTR